MADTDDDVVIDEPQAEVGAEIDEVEQTPAAEIEAAPEPEEITVTIDGESPAPEEFDAEKARHAFAQARIRERELKAELERLKQQAQPEVKPQTLGAKPRIEDFNYDAEEFATATDKWYADKAAFDRQQEEAQAAQRKQAEAWQGILSGYETGKKALKVADFDDVETDVRAKLNQVQQGILLQGAKGRAAELVYALGKHPTKLSELAAITDPVEFAVAVGELKGRTQVQPKTKPATQPEPRVAPTAPGAGLGSIETLREKAEKTGDYSAYHAALRERRLKSR